VDLGSFGGLVKLFVLLWAYKCYKIYENMEFKKNNFGWLVGAFSVFGPFDTGNPVQIWALFLKSTIFLFPEGLI